MSNKIEDENILSQHNYGSRRGCSIKTELLEKNKETEDVITPVMPDLEACYDRQIPELCGVPEKNNRNECKGGEMDK